MKKQSPNNAYGADRSRDALQEALKRAEEEKNKSDAIIAAIGDGISIQDLDYRVLYQNEIHRQLIGNHVGEHCYRAYERRDTVCEGCPVALSYQDGLVHTVERTAPTDHGLIHVEITSSPLRDSSGKIIAGIEVARDITLRKRSEEAFIGQSRHAMLIADIGSSLTRGDELQPVLQECAEAIVNHLDAYFARIWTVDTEGTTLALQASAGAYTRLDGEHGRITVGHFKIGIIAQEKKPHLTNTVIGDPTISDQEWARKEGVIAFAGHPLIVEDKLVGVMGLFAKHTLSEATLLALSSIADEIALGIERKRIEAERETLLNDLKVSIETVSRSHKEWRDTFDSIQDPIYITDIEYRIVKANKAFVAFTGMDFPEVLSRKCYELLYNPADPYQNSLYQSLRETGNPVDVEITSPDGKMALVVSHFPYVGPAGEFGGSISIVRDVTADREKEMRLIMNERLASLGQMAASIAHEINNPLAAILGCAEGLLNRVKQDRYDPILFKNYLTIVQEEIERCRKITTGMLSFVRKSAAERSTMDIHAVLDRTLEIIGLQGRLNRVEVRKTYSHENGSVFGSEGELRQVFLSLISNALDAMRERGVLAIGTAGGDKGLVITISDTGIGIPPENINRIFDPFFSTKSEQNATGLGLSISRKILGNHGGEISVSSEQGKGTSFTIILPLAE